MACLILTGITRSCGYSFGGVQNVYLTNRQNVTAKKNNTTNIVTGFTITNSDKFFKFESEPETSQLIEELQAGATTFIKQTVTLVLSNINQTKREILEKLGLASLTAVVQDQAGIYWLVGNDGAGLKPITLSIDTGKAKGDLNGATIVLEGAGLGYANEVQPSALTSLLA
jgi:hypothetical protein